MPRPVRPAPLDPALFAPAAVAAETHAANARIGEVLAAAPGIWEAPPAATRAARAEGRGWQGPIVRLEQARVRSIPGPGGEVPVRVFVPEQVRGVHLYIHGGGWVLGGADQQDQALWDLATAAQCAVVSVEYRLAPEHPYPAAPDDCEAVALWLARHAQRELGSARITIGGGSAGAHLAAVTLLRMRDRHGFTDFAGADLVFGVYDCEETPSLRAGANALLLPRPAMRWFIDCFVPPALRGDPDVSPLRANLHEMPPALFTVGTLDPLLDDSLFMHQRWIAAGNQAELAVYPGGIHGFVAMPTAIGAAARARSQEFIRDALAGG